MLVKRIDQFLELFGLPLFPLSSLLQPVKVRWTDQPTGKSQRPPTTTGSNTFSMGARNGAVLLMDQPPLIHKEFI